MPRPGNVTKTTLHLPTLDENIAPAAGVIRHVVAILLVILCTSAAVAVGVATLVTLNVTVKASGILEPTRVWPVRSVEGGTIIETTVASGDTVRRGQILVTLDSLGHAATVSALRTRIAELRLQLRRDSSTLRLSRLDAEEQGRFAAIALVRARASLRQKLVDYGVPDDVDSLLRTYRRGGQVALDLAVADVEEAESHLRTNDLAKERSVAGGIDLARQFATLRGLQREVGTAESRAARLHLRSPARGVVVTEQVHQLTGRRVQEGELVLEIAEPDAWQAVLTLSERNVHKVRLNDAVKLEIGALSAKAQQLSGRITYVGRQPHVTTDGATVGGAFRVVVALDSTIESLRRGYTVRAHIIARSGRIIKLAWDYVRDR